MNNDLLASLRREREARRPPPVLAQASAQQAVLSTKRARDEEASAGADVPAKRVDAAADATTRAPETARQTAETAAPSGEPRGEKTAPPPRAAPDTSVVDLTFDSDNDDAAAAPPAQPSHDGIDLTGESDDDDDLAFARRLQAEEYAQARGPAPHAPPPAPRASGDVLVHGGASPWPSRADWYEFQHKPGQCGNFDVCSKGNSYFTDGRDVTAHGLLPRPMPGQTIRVHYKPHAQDPSLLRVGTGSEKRRRDVDGTTRTLVGRTRSYARFSMPPCAGRVETFELGFGGEPVYVIRNYDGARGAKLAANLQGCFGLDVLDPPSGKGTMAKCAAAQGNNCQDDYTKLYPLRMFADDQHFELLAPILDGAIQAVGGARVCDKRRGERPGELVTGEAQILRFISGKTAKARGNRMHVHVDKRGTRWVAIATLGDTASFVVDRSARCLRCHTGGGRLRETGKHWRDWYKIDCPTCQDIKLASGDVLLFFGDPEALVAHGNMGTLANTAPPGLPSWCYGGRVSCQYRLPKAFMDRSGRIY